MNDEKQWLLCPICRNKTRLQIRTDTELKNFPLFCPKCKQETLINVKQFNVSALFASGSLMTDTLNCLTLIKVSCLHFGQNSGNFNQRQTI